MKERKWPRKRPSFWPAWHSNQPVNKDEQSQPDHVHKVPVPGHSLKREVVFRGKVAFHGAKQHHKQHQCTHGHMKSMEAREHEERGAINARAQGQPQPIVSLMIFVRLQKQERKAKADW